MRDGVRFTVNKLVAVHCLPLAREADRNSCMDILEREEKATWQIGCM